MRTKSIARNFCWSLAFGMLALATGLVCHRLCPGLGLVLMPMFWPLAVLGMLVPARWALATAAIVPFVSCMLTGMPMMPVVVSLKFVVFVFVLGGFLKLFTMSKRS